MNQDQEEPGPRQAWLAGLPGICFSRSAVSPQWGGHHLAREQDPLPVPAGKASLPPGGCQGNGSGLLQRRVGKYSTGLEKASKLCLDLAL